MNLSGVLLMTCLSLIGAASANKGHYMCGSTLADVMSLICGERGYLGFHKKTDGVNNVKNKATLPFRSPLYARRLHKLINECCYNMCSFSVLESYCNPWPSTAEPNPNDVGDAAEIPEEVTTISEYGSNHVTRDRGSRNGLLS